MQGLKYICILNVDVAINALHVLALGSDLPFVAPLNFSQRARGTVPTAQL